MSAGLDHEAPAGPETPPTPVMPMMKDLLKLLDKTLGLDGRALAFTADTELLCSVPELDSIGVVSVITALEEHFGFTIEDDEIDGPTFATVGSLLAFVESKLAQA